MSDDRIAWCPSCHRWRLLSTGRFVAHTPISPPIPGQLTIDDELSAGLAHEDARMPA